MNEIELLAPAGNYDSLKVAINNGANAVYLGLDDFNARIKADNFTCENIANVVEYAHLRNVKVYVTVNIIIKDEEYASLYQMIKCTIEAGVDAYLIQDLGVASFLRKNFPNICLHASTQMGIHNLMGARMAEKLGFKRIVLSRETKEEDIIDIRKNTNLEIEYFIQGALCVSFSGNCYYSSFKTLNSGNRGRCQQLCRLKYQSFENDKFLKSGYLLSPRDLCLLEDVQRLSDLGICSLKIEGRLRRPGYVATAVKTYRKILDMLNRGKTPSHLEDDIHNLKKVFSRGDFNCHAYLDKGTPDDIINPDIQNHLGIKVGKSVSCKPFKDIYEIEVYSPKHIITKGDGLKFISDGKEVASIGVGNVNCLSSTNYKLYSKNKVINGSDMYLTLDNELEEKNINNTLLLPLDVYCYAYSDSPLVVTVNHLDYSYTYTSEYIVQKATKNPTTKEEIISQLSKVNDNGFFIKSIDVQCDECFIPKSIVNEARRNAVDELTRIIIESRHPHYQLRNNDDLSIATKKELSYDKPMILINEKIKVDVLSNFNLEDYLIVFSFENWSQAKPYIEYIRGVYPNNDIAVNLPIITSKEDIYIVNKVLDEYRPIIIANNIGHLDYLNKYKVIAGPGLNIISSNSVATYLNMGCMNVIMSLECSSKILNKHINNYAYVYGRNTLMNFTHCPYKLNYGNKCSKCSFNDSLNYQDEHKEKMMIRRQKINLCYFELLNSKVICNYGKINNPFMIDIRSISKNDIESLSNMMKGEKEFFTNSYSGLLDKDIK